MPPIAAHTVLDHFEGSLNGAYCPCLMVPGRWCCLQTAQAVQATAGDRVTGASTKDILQCKNDSALLS